MIAMPRTKAGDPCEKMYKMTVNDRIIRKSHQFLELLDVSYTYSLIMCGL